MFEHRNAIFIPKTTLTPIKWRQKVTLAWTLTSTSDIKVRRGEEEWGEEEWGEGHEGIEEADAQDMPSVPCRSQRTRPGLQCKDPLTQFKLFDAILQTRAINDLIQQTCLAMRIVLPYDNDGTNCTYS